MRLSILHTITMNVPLALRKTRMLLPIVLVTPSFRADIGTDTDADTPGSLIASGAPGPSGTAGNGQVIPAETEPRGSDSDETAENHVKSMVTVVGETGARDVDGGTDRNEDQDQGVDGWCGCLITDGDDVLFGVDRGGGLFVVSGEESRASTSEIGTRSNCRCMSRVGAEGTRREERNSNSEFRGKEEGEVEKSSPGNY